MFECDEQKRVLNIERHGIDFIRAKELWHGRVLEMVSPQSQHNEQRVIAIGKVQGQCIAMIYTWRGHKRRLISARRARKNERKAYYHALG